MKTTEEKIQKKIAQAEKLKNARQKTKDRIDTAKTPQQRKGLRERLKQHDEKLKKVVKDTVILAKSYLQK